MSPTRHAAWFFVRLVLLYGVLAFPWRPIESAYSRAFAWCADGLLAPSDGNQGKGLYGTGGVVRVYSQYEKDRERDINIVAGNLSKKVLSETNETSSRHLAYMPAAFVVSLVLASPVNWKRRVFALFWCMLLVHAFIGTRLIFILVRIFHGEADHCLFYLDPPWNHWLNEAYNLIAVVPASIYLVPLFIWVAVTFKRGDWEHLKDMGIASNNRSAEEPVITNVAQTASRGRKAKSS